MALFTFTTPAGKTFEIKGPEGLSFEQAQQIFNKQLSTGSLVGLKSGDVLSAASQAAAGLKSAQAALGQATSKITGALGGGIATATGAIGSVIKDAGNAAGSLISKASAAAGSIAGQATSAVNSALASAGGAPIAGINTANFVKQATALAPIGSMNVTQVTGVLAQAKNLVGQAYDKMTDLKGVGSFGFDLKQLEASGIIKPGTSKLLESGASKLTSILKSPSVFTGKDGITSAKSLLSSVPTQDKLQQGLMATGVAGMKSLGIPTDSLDPSKLAGLALGAAKSLPNVDSLVKGLPLPAGVKAGLDAAIKDGAFAVKLTDLKIPPAVKLEEVPVVASATVNRETVTAATGRVLGNEKIPPPEYGPRPESGTTVNDIIESFNKVNALISSVFTKLQDIETQLIALEAQPTVTEAEWDLVNGQYQIVRAEFNNSTVRADGFTLYRSAPIDVQNTTKTLYNILVDRVNNLLEFNLKIKARLAALKQKIQ